MNFSNLKVGVRLGWGFAVVILAGLVVAMFGSLELGAVNTEVTALVEDRMVKVEQLNQVKENLNVVARAIRNIALMSDEKTEQAEQQRILDARAQNAELLKKLEASIVSEQGRKLLQDIAEIRAPYNATVDKALALGLANNDAETRDVLINENRPLQAAYFKALNALIGLQKSAMDSTAKHVQETTAATRLAMLIIAAVAAMAGGLIAWVLTRSITRQLGGEPDYASNVAREIAAGNLVVDVQLRGGDESSLLAAMKAMRDSLARVVSQVRQGSESVATASVQISQGNNDLSARTEEQASALEETAASMEELSSTVKQNADNARQANQLAQSASTVAVRGGEVVAQVVDTMKGINDSSHKIADIISVIDGIAFQTNILALNAAVEAARAGEQGRGFAVVASEVRSLAGRSADAAKEIKNLITASVERVAQGTELVDQAGTTMTEVVTSIKRVTDIMGEISAASSEQSAGVSQVGEAVTQMDQATQQNAALVEESAAAADSLKTQAEQLVQAVSVFRLSEQAVQARVTVARTPAPAGAAVQVAAVGSKRPSPVRVGNAASPPPKVALRKPALSLANSSASQAGADDWESF
jgi:methyl-accepting chemotaxis protein